ncbi:MAG: hypothetical protein NC324_02285 [Bacteroides sp.]|nr:hypothetical protein [Bacteroides sp.]
MGKLNNYAGLFGAAVLVLLVYQMFFAGKNTGDASKTGSFLGKRGK